MRLIDADKLESVDFSECTDSMEIMAIIDAQPTAYDVGKVVEQLDELRKECKNPLYDYDPNYFIDKAIEIVKGSGVNDNTVA